MKLSALILTAFFLGSAVSSFSQTTAQSEANTIHPVSSDYKVEYPKDEAGVLINSSGWAEIFRDSPADSHLKRAFAASLTYGAIPSRIVVEYDGPHADVQLPSGQPILCVCHVPGVLDPPVLIRLHSKKNSRELDGGRIPILRGKIGEVTKSDVIDADVSRPESTVWLIQPREALSPGEYALMVGTQKMMGTQNMAIFPFTVLEDSKTHGSAPQKTSSR